MKLQAMLSDSCDAKRVCEVISVKGVVLSPTRILTEKPLSLLPLDGTPIASDYSQLSTNKDQEIFTCILVKLGKTLWCL